MDSKQTQENQTHAGLAAASGSADSLIAAIEGDRSKMAHGDLVLTCQMLERGRARWRKEAEEAQEALREIVMLCGDPDPSDGEGTSPAEVVDLVRCRLSQPNKDYATPVRISVNDSEIDLPKS